MLRVGIINPDWTPQRHNTDHTCVVDFAHMDVHTDALHLDFAGGRLQYLQANLNRVSQRLSGRWVFPRIPVDASPERFDVLYRYGNEALGLQPDSGGRPPLVSTVGFPGIRQEVDKGQAFLAQRARDLRETTQDSACLHFHTEVMRELYVEQNVADHSRTVTVPFYLPHLAFVDVGEVARKFEQAETLLVFVGADGTRKGLAELCDALDVVAQDPAARTLRATIVSQTKPSCRRFTSLEHETSLSRTAVQALMRQAHLYCMVPHRETFGLVYVEAMASGCAVIADDDLPRQEILDHGRCGLMLPRARVDLLARAILDLLHDRARMRSLALAGLERARVRYSPVAVASAYARVFKALADQQPVQQP